MSAPVKALNFECQSMAQFDAWNYLMDSTTRSLGYGGSAGGGKSFLGCGWIWMMCNTYPGVRYFFGRKELKKLKQTTLVSYYEFCDLYDVPLTQRGHLDGQASIIRFANGSEIVLIDLAWKPSDPLGDTYGGLLLTGGFIDESCECPYKYIQVLYSRIGRWKNQEYGITPKILEASNPDKGHFYRRFFDPHRRGEESTKTKFIPALLIDRLKFPKYFLRHRKVHPKDVGTKAGIYVNNLLELDDAMQQRLLYGNFDYDDDPLSLIEFGDITDFFDSSHLAPGADRYLTADIAMQGSDQFVIVAWRGMVAVDIRVLAKSGGMDILSEVRAMQEKHGVRDRNVTYDADGVGSFLGGAGGFIPSARPFVNGSVALKSKGVKENYANLKTQCYYHLARAISNGEMRFAAKIDGATRQLIEEELGQIKRTTLDPDGKLRIKSKKDIRRDIGRSPDFTDTLAMRMLFALGGKKKVEYL